jgi:saccharopine dehydrogenase-like NADP-dependent oxidoreductase
MSGKTCAGVWVTGTGIDGRPRSTYLYHVADNEETMREYGSQAVVWQTAINPVIALELLATGCGPVPACSAPRPSTRSRSSTCSPRPRRRLRLAVGHGGQAV